MKRSGILTENRKKWVVGTVCLLIAGVFAVTTLSAFTFGGKEEEQAETVYRENTVQRGDIVVGVSETATTTLKTHDIRFDVNARIEEIYVKAGQTVQEGDPVVKLSTSSLQEQLSSLQMDYQKAQIELNQANVSLQKGEIEAQNTYNTAISKSETADSTYDLTIEKLEMELTRAKATVGELKAEIYSYTRMLHNIDSDSEEYTAALIEYQDAKEALNKAKEALKNATDEELAERTQQLEEAQTAFDYYETAYEGLNEEYTDTYGDYDEDTIIQKRKEAREKLEDATMSLAEAENNLALKKLEAEQTKSSTVTTAGQAKSIYDITLAELQNSIASKQLNLQSIQKEIDEIKGYIEKGVITALCSGLVMSVSYEPGDEVPANTAIAVLSDSSSVYAYVAVAQDDISSLTLGQEATLTLDAFEDETFTGIIDSISTTPARNASGSASYNVTVKVEGDISKIFEGMTGTLTLITRQQKDVLYVSMRCVYEKDGQSYVKVKDENGEILEAPVTTGFSDGRNVEITGGLEEGQTVLIESQVVAQK